MALTERQRNEQALAAAAREAAMAAHRAAQADLRAREERASAAQEANRRAAHAAATAAQRRQDEYEASQSASVRRHNSNVWAWGAIRIRCSAPKTDVTVMMGDGAPIITGGLGGWEVIDRPRQVGMTVWKGVEPFQVSIPLQFEGWLATSIGWGKAGGIDMNPDLYELMNCARGNDERPPGIVRVYGLPLPAQRWVIEELELEGDGAILRPEDRALLRQPAVLILREYVPPSYLRVSKRALDSPKARTKIVTAKKGDTPAKLAKRYHTSYKVLLRLNPKIGKANRDLKTGSKWRVPIPDPADRKKTSKRQGASGAAGRAAGTAIGRALGKR